jgi:hypothetical protein
LGLPLSRTKIDQLGKRLAGDHVPAEEDLRLLQGLIVAYDEPLADVAATLATVGVAVTTRLKTVATTIEKLRREHASEGTRSL